MTDTLTTAKSLTKQTVGGNSGTWGTIENATWDLVDKALGQTLTKALTVNVTLTSTEAQNIGYDFTGAIASNLTVTFPTFYGPAFIRNKTTGGFTLTVGMASGLTAKVPFGSNVLLFSDGTDFVRVDDAGASVNVAPSNPSGTTSATRVMMGVGDTCTITPRKTGVVLFGAHFNITPPAIDSGTNWHFRYGTGTRPLNGVAETGTGILAQSNQGIGNQCPTIMGVVTGLTVGTAYWFDISIAALSGGSVSVGGISAWAVEQG